MTDDGSQIWAQAFGNAQVSILQRRAEAIRTLNERRERELAWLRASLQADDAPAWLIDLVIENWQK